MIYQFIRWLTVIIILISSLILFILTPLGSRSLFAIATQFMPGKLTYQHFLGTLIGPLTITQLNYQYQGQEFHIGTLNLKWQPSALLRGHLGITNCLIHDVDIITPMSHHPSSHQKKYSEFFPHQPLKWPLPFGIKIQNLYIQHIRWGDVKNHWLMSINTLEARGKLYPQLFDFYMTAHLESPSLDAITSILPNPTLAKQLKKSINKPIVSLHLTGQISDYQANLILKNDKTSWFMNAKGGLEYLILKTPANPLMNGSFNTQIKLNWNKQFTWELFFEGIKLNLKTLNSKLPKLLTINLKTSGHFQDNIPYLTWFFDLKTPTNQIQTQGEYHIDLQANWQLNITQLNELWPGSIGNIKSEGKISGKWPYLISQGEFLAQHLRWQTFQVEQLKSQWAIDSHSQKTSIVNLIGEKAGLFGFFVRTFNLNGRGTLDQHQIDLALQDANNNLNLSILGQWKQNTWKAIFQQLQFNSYGMSPWKLQKPSQLLWSTHRIQLDPVCVYSNNNRICTSLLKENNHWQFNLKGQLNLQDLNLLPSEIVWQMPLTFDINAVSENTTLKTATVNLILPPSTLILSTLDNTHIPLQGGKILLQIKPKLASLDLQLNIDHANSVGIQLKLPNYSPEKGLNPQQKIQGQIKFQAENLELIDHLIPDVSLLPGRLEGQWSVSGTLADPQINGQLHLKQSKVIIPELNITLDNIQLSGKFTKKALEFKAIATSSGHPIQATGVIDLTQPKLSTKIHVTSDNVLIMNTTEFVVYAKPDIMIEIKGFNVSITGQAMIPQAQIHPADIKGVVTLPKYDTIIINGPEKKPSPWSLEVQMNVVLGDNVMIDAMGLKGQLQGQGVITHHHQQPTIANGHITIQNGHYTILSRELNLSPNSGVIYHDNLLENPNLNLQVFTYVTVNDSTGQELVMDNVKVGVNVSGTASAPQLSFFSSPITLSPNDILSYLVLGSPGGSTTTPAASGLLLQALNVLRPAKQPQSVVGNLSSELKEGLGISELGVETDTELAPLGETTNRQTTYVVFGKRITPRLFARYKFDPFSSNNIFTLYYLLTQHIRIQSEKTNLGSGIDVLYTIEKKNKTKLDKNCNGKTASTTH